ncbi:MAG: bifunctional transcriptional activator/DNA repair enzyme protein Ada, partial [Nitrospinae bacterium]|nr:bifunctional transcriptional activator/DNA repair enzyme protein Ada [Nitrospinota bacterium]
YEAGYGSSRGVYEGASRYMGMTPATYKKGGAGVSIRYGITSCGLGRLLVAATGKGVCRVSIGERVGELVSDLKNEYPHSNLRRSDDDLKDHLNIVARLAEGESPSESLPLDVRASAFQCRV